MIGEDPNCRPHSAMGRRRRGLAGGQVAGRTHRSAGRIMVMPDLSVPDLPNVFAIGDTTIVTGSDGRHVPGLARRRGRAGAYVARLIRARIEDRRAPGPFRYKHLGSMATIGAGRRRRPRPAEAMGMAGVVAVGRCARRLPGRRAQPLRRDIRLGLGLSHLPAAASG